MERDHPLSTLLEQQELAPKLFPADRVEIDALRQENERLKELVVQLSAIIMRNVTNQK